jgi:DNA-directed RNA polymerase alpha subunit
MTTSFTCPHCGETSLVLVELTAKDTPTEVNVNIPVKNIAWGNRRIPKIFHDEGIVTLRDLISRNDPDLLRLHGFNRISLNHVKGVLASMGLHLGLEV